MVGLARWWVAAFVVGLVFLAWPQRARACSCLGVGPDVALDQSDAVFEGTVVATYEGRGSRMAVVRVETVHKGRGLVGLAGVSLGGKSTSCEMRMPVGERWLVYAARKGERLGTGLCSRTARISKAEEDLAFLGQGRSVPVLDLHPPEPDDWLSASLETDPLTPGSAVRRLDIEMTPPKGPGPRVPVAVALVLDVSGSAAAPQRVISSALRILAELPDGSLLSLIDAHAPKPALLPLVSLDASTRSEAESHLKSLSAATAGADLNVPLNAAAGEISGASLQHAARFVVVIRGDAMPTGPAIEPWRRTASRMQGGFVAVSTIGTDPTADFSGLRQIADAGGGRFVSASPGKGLLAKVAAEASNMVNTRVALASLEVIAEPGVRVLGGKHADASRYVEAATVRVGSLNADAPRKATLYLDVPDTLDPEDVAARVRLRYWDPRGTIGQVVEAVSVKRGGP